MPLYTVSAPQEISSLARQRIAQGITDIHCELTGALPQFVQVVFSFNVPLTKKFKGHLLGSIRAGRPPEIKAALTHQISECIAKNLNTQRENIQAVLLDVPASWVIEGGEIMPEPGDEEDWLQRIQGA